MASKHKPPVQHEVKMEQQEAEEDSFHSAAEAPGPAPTEKPEAGEELPGALSHPETKPQVYEDYDCMLCQTDIENNNNKFYIIRLLQEGDGFSCQSLWGRVGEVGQSDNRSFRSLEDEKKCFEKKFREKTKNPWSDRHRFKLHPDKYTLIDTYRDTEALDATVKVRPCSLDEPTQNLIASISTKDVFGDAMALMNLDIKKTPLKMLSLLQITRGLVALEKLEEAMRDPTATGHSLNELSSRFYSIIPHNFGRKKPPLIDSPTLLQAKKDMLLVLAIVIKLVQTQKEDLKEEGVKDVPHPLDQAYELLECQLQLLGPNEPEYKMIQTYLKETGKDFEYFALGHVWKVNRDAEEISETSPPPSPVSVEAYMERDNKIQETPIQLDIREPLWYGTNMAVVAAILNSGLHIVPYARGLVDLDMFYESHPNVRYMFLDEATLDMEHYSGPSVGQPAPGFGGTAAQGHSEPNLTQDTEPKPEGQPGLCPEFRSFTFSQSEYLLSQEDSQSRPWYLLEVRL